MNRLRSGKTDLHWIGMLSQRSAVQNRQGRGNLCAVNVVLTGPMVSTVESGR